MLLLKRVLRALPLLLLSPLLVGLSAFALALTDLFWKLFGSRETFKILEYIFGLESKAADDFQLRRRAAMKE